MRIGIVGLGLIGGSLALALRDAHDVVAFDRDLSAAASARERGLTTVERLEDLFPCDAAVVATPLAAIVPALREIAPRAGGAVLLEVGSLKKAASEFAASAPETMRQVGLHPMAGSTAQGLAAADASLFRGRPMLVVTTARSDDRAMTVAGEIARDVGGVVTVCSPEVHDRAVAAISALPLATAIALRRVARAGSPVPYDAVAGTGIRDTTRLADTPPELALPLLGAPGLREHIASLREGLAEIEGALGDEAALRALLGSAAKDVAPR
jgi:prephenate dehydrogenase